MFSIARFTSALTSAFPPTDEIINELRLLAALMSDIVARRKIPYLRGGLRGFRSPRIMGCNVTDFAPHKALKLIA